jgi:succinate dehydrogenase / fumarate reductase membrane anchor subunit
MSKNNIGANRLVVGAHYGLTEWLLQRVTAVIMVIYTVILFGVYLMYGNASYEGWSSLFANQIMKILTFLTLLSLFTTLGLEYVIFGWITLALLAYV